jgi:pyroglutamyl-peptidase
VTKKRPAPILVTGFEPFGGESVNPSALVAQALAGTFVCNHVFYGLQHALRMRRSVRSGLMHLPLLHEQARAGQPSLALPVMIDSTALALATALRQSAGDLHMTEGALD